MPHVSNSLPWIPGSFPAPKRDLTAGHHLSSVGWGGWGGWNALCFDFDTNEELFRGHLLRISAEIEGRFFLLPAEILTCVDTEELGLLRQGTSADSCYFANCELSFLLAAASHPTSFLASLLSLIRTCLTADNVFYNWNQLFDISP